MISWRMLLLVILACLLPGGFILLAAVVDRRVAYRWLRAKFSARKLKIVRPRLVVIESPFAGDTEANQTYLRACIADCFRRGEFPYASHGLYTQPGILDDKDPAQRALGMRAGFAWGRFADLTAVYVDRGISEGMWRGVAWAEKLRRPVEYRNLNDLPRR